MVNYDKFEIFIINKMSEYANNINKDDNTTEVHIFSELMEILYQYEKEKINGDICTY